MSALWCFPDLIPNHRAWNGLVRRVDDHAFNIHENLGQFLASEWQAIPWAIVGITSGEWHPVMFVLHMTQQMKWILFIPYYPSIWSHNCKDILNCLVFFIFGNLYSYVKENISKIKMIFSSYTASTVLPIHLYIKYDWN